MLGRCIVHTSGFTRWKLWKGHRYAVHVVHGLESFEPTLLGSTRPIFVSGLQFDSGTKSYVILTDLWKQAATRLDEPWGIYGSSILPLRKTPNT